VQALATFANQRNVVVPKDVIDQLIHCWFFKLASGATFAAESGRSLYFLLQKVPDI
jgi:hypothetical protein